MKFHTHSYDYGLRLIVPTRAYPTPDWLGEEITSDGRFTNAYLSKHPFGSWER